MISKESDCVDCPSDFPCLGRECPHYQHVILTCDECGLECDEEESWEIDGEIVCDDCILEYLENKGTIKRPKISDYLK